MHNTHPQYKFGPKPLRVLEDGKDSDVGSFASSVLWDPTSKLSWLNPDGFVLWYSLVQSACPRAMGVALARRGFALCGRAAMVRLPHFSSMAEAAQDSRETASPGESIRRHLGVGEESWSTEDGKALLRRTLSLPRLGDARSVLSRLELEAKQQLRRPGYRPRYLSQSVLDISPAQTKYLASEWLLQMLDNPALVGSLFDRFDGARTLPELAYLQWGSGNVTRAIFNRDSVADLNFVNMWDAEGNHVVESVHASGLPEFPAFCRRGSLGPWKSHYSFAPCNVRLSISQSRRLFGTSLHLYLLSPPWKTMIRLASMHLTHRQA